MKNNWRIYLSGRGYRHCRPFLDWCKTLPEVKEDRKGNKYIFVNDLLKYKGQLVGTNLHNKTRLSWRTWFLNQVIAFNEVDKFIESLNLSQEVIEDLKRYKLAEFTFGNFFTNKELKEIFKTAGLEEWID